MARSARTACKKFTLSLPVELYERLRLYAFDLDTSKTKAASYLINKALDSEGKLKKSK